MFFIFLSFTTSGKEDEGLHSCFSHMFCFSSSWETSRSFIFRLSLFHNLHRIYLYFASNLPEESLKRWKNRDNCHAIKNRHHALDLLYCNSFFQFVCSYQHLRTCYFFPDKPCRLGDGLILYRGCHFTSILGWKEHVSHIAEEIFPSYYCRMAVSCPGSCLPCQFSDHIRYCTPFRCDCFRSDHCSFFIFYNEGQEDTSHKKKAIRRILISWKEHHSSNSTNSLPSAW